MTLAIRDAKLSEEVQALTKEAESSAILLRAAQVGPMTSPQELLQGGEPPTQGHSVFGCDELKFFAVGRFAPSVPAGQVQIEDLSAGQPAEGSIAKDFQSVVPAIAEN